MTLRSRGQDPSRIVPQLFSTYLACEAEDTPFYRYIEYLENSFNEGANYDSETLMFKAEEKYKELVERHQIKSGKGKPDDMIALQAQVAELTEVIKKNGDKGGGNPGKDKDKDPNRKQAAWTFQKPKQGEAHTKTVNDKVYHWCDGKDAKHHKAKWVRHDPKDCGKRGGPAPAAKGSPPQTPPAEGTPKGDTPARSQVG